MREKSNRGLVLGVTGGIACGKSEVGYLLAHAGFEVLDADDVAHRLMAPEGGAYRAVIEHFGVGICGDDGKINRRKLAETVFDNDAELKTLNRIVHPLVCEEWRGWIRERCGAGKNIAVIIPLLFEIEENAGWDAVICVAANEEIVIERLKSRGLTEIKAQARIAAQLPLKDKIKRSDYVIRNNGSLEDLYKTTHEQLDKLLSERKG